MAVFVLFLIGCELRDWTHYTQVYGVGPKYKEVLTCTPMPAAVSRVRS